MLPSTGYFKGISCAFYENGTCDRPYCHFKHSKREDAGVAAAEAVETVENRATGPVQGSETDVSSIVAEAGMNATSGTERRTDAPTLAGKGIPCVYNPTPIAELKKRHIPIASYMPTRESRIAVKRKVSPDRTRRSPWLHVGGGGEGAGSDKSAESPSELTEVKYRPTAILGGNTEPRDAVQNCYVPTCRSDSASSNATNDEAANEYLLKLKEVYYPRSKRRREEYVPKKVKAPLKSVDGLTDSASNDFDTGTELAEQEELTPVADAASLPNVQLTAADPFPPRLDVEPKFSDDEDEEEQMLEEQEVEDGGQLDGETVCQASKQGNAANDLQAVKVDKETEGGGRSGRKCGLENGKERTSSREKSRSRERKERKEHGTSRKGEKDRHSSHEKSHSSSNGKSKERSRTRHESNQSDSRKHDRRKSRHKDREKCAEKEKEKEKGKSKEKSKEKKEKDRSETRHKFKKDKRDRPESNKHREHDAQKEVRVKGNGGRSRKRSKSDAGDGRAVENEKSKSPFKERFHLQPTNDYEAEEENDDDEDDVGVDSAVFGMSDSDHDVQEECLRIFQEYQVPERSEKEVTQPVQEAERKEEQSEEVGRKRVAHPSAALCVGRPSGAGQPARRAINPQQRMYERWRIMREAAAEKSSMAVGDVLKKAGLKCSDATRIVGRTAEPPTTTTTTTTPPTPASAAAAPTTVTAAMATCELRLNGNAASRIRIAHVPYAKSLAVEKKKVGESVCKSAETKTSADSCKTAAQTTKSGVRVAHVPQTVPQLIRPEPLQVATQKFPLNVRQYYVNMMHDVCVSIYTNPEDAAQRAVKEEYACHERCKALAVYKNSCMLATHRLRKEVDQKPASGQNSGSASSAGQCLVSHEAVLAGKTRGTWSVLKTKRAVTEFHGRALYGMLKKWILSEEQLRKNGFPRPHPDGQKGRAKVYVINSRNQTVLSKVPNERMCSRCGKSYTIDKKGFPLKSQNCIYHWGKKFTIRGEGKYSCCQQYGSAGGCCDAKTHVWDYTDYENLRGYVKTLPKDTPVEEQGVYALDCEMCYTTQGLELCRITVIDEHCNVVYETLVKPENSIIDYNTRFSGLTEESMEGVTSTLLDVQATLLTMFSENTILVGHSLESDFKALKLLHDTVVDTSVMFPHKNGYPQKRALKNLCSEYLRKLIQNDVGGHDSKEDAVACMELILWKVKEEAKLQ